MINKLRATRRALAFFLAGGWMMFRIWLMRLIKGKDLDRALKYKREFLAWLIPAMGIQVEVFGKTPDKAGILMSNHRSYFDPILPLRDVLGLPVGKVEVKSWPIIGWGAELAGTVWVDRSTSEGRQAARDTINRRLAKGHSILIYAEGTIYHGPELGELKRGMFRDAAEEGYTIYPCAIEYQHAEDTWKDMSFAKHFYRQFGRQDFQIRLSYGPALSSKDADELLAKTKKWIEAEILRLREGWFKPAHS